MNHENQPFESFILNTAMLSSKSGGSRGVNEPAKFGKIGDTENISVQTEISFEINRYLCMVLSVNPKVIFCPASWSHLLIKLTVDQLKDKIKTKNVKIIMGFLEINLIGQFS